MITVLEQRATAFVFRRSNIRLWRQRGDGETFKKAKPKVVKNSKFKRGTQQAKFIELPSAEPADRNRRCIHRV